MNINNPFELTDKEIHDLAVFTGTYDENADEETIKHWRETYRKVEAESNMQIKNAGGVKNWYESGQGRLI